MYAWFLVVTSVVCQAYSIIEISKMMFTPTLLMIGPSRQVQELVDQALARFGQIGILINNAGVITVGPCRL